MGAVIFNGAFVKTLKANCKFLENVFIVTDQAADPSSVAYSAPTGSLYFRSGTNEIYKKQDNGSSTNWSKLGSLTEMLAFYGNITKDPTGFPNRTDSNIGVTEASRTFWVAPAITSFDIYQKGVKSTFVNAQTIIFPDVEGLHHFYFDNGVITTTQVFDISIITDKVYIANLYWDAANNLNLLLGDERHGLSMDGITHAYLHQVFKAKYISGLALANFVPDSTGNLDTHAQFSLALGKMADEDIELSIDAVGVGVAQVPFFYLEGASANWRRSLPNGFPVRTTGTGRAAYNQFTGGAWQQTEVTSNNYVLTHVFATNDQNYSGYVFIQGQAQYTSLTNARIGATTEINSISTGALAFQEFIPVGTVIFQTVSGYANAVKSRVRTTDTGASYVDWRNQNLTAGSGSSDHGSLSGLQDDDHTTLYKRIHLPTAATGTISVLNTVQRGTFYLADSSGGNVTFNLDALANFPDGFEITIKKTSLLNAVIIDANAAELIDGVGLLVLTDLNDQVTLVKQTAQWQAKGRTVQQPLGLITGDDYIPRNSVGGWLAYADAAGIIPVDMTGGAPTVSIARNLTTPISDIADWVFTKDAANRQGEGFSRTYTNIPSKYKSRGCIFRFKYLTSAAYVDNAVGLFLYDITGAVVYQLNPLYLKKSGLIESSFAEIQLPNTLTSGFRIGFHVIGTDTTAYTIQLTEFTFDEKVTSQNSSITDFRDSIVSSTWDAGITYNNKKERVLGDSLELEFSFRISGSVSGTFEGNLPYAIDTNKYAYLNSSGRDIDVSGGAYLSTGGYAPIGIEFTDLTATKKKFQVVIQDPAANVNTFGRLTNVFPYALSSTNSEIKIKIKVPIQGWSAGTQVSDIYTGRTVASDVYLSATQTGVNPNNSAVKINFNAVRNDTIGAFSTGAFRYNFLTSGWYDFSSTIYLLGSNVIANVYRLLIYKNGSLFFVGDQVTPSAGTAFNLSAGSKRLFSVGDYLEVYLYGAGNNSASTLSVYEDGTGAWSYFNINRIAGENQPLAGEKIIAKYQRATSQTIASLTYTVVDFSTKVSDTHNAVTVGANFRFTSPRSSFYNFKTGLEYTDTFGATDTLIGSFHKNNASSTGGAGQDTGTSRLAAVSSGSAVRLSIGPLPAQIYLAQGEWVDFRTYQSNAASKSLSANAAFNYFEVESI